MNEINKLKEALLPNQSFDPNNIYEFDSLIRHTERKKIPPIKLLRAACVPSMHLKEAKETTEYYMENPDKWLIHAKEVAGQVTSLDITVEELIKTYGLRHVLLTIARYAKN